jgi:nicotinamidase-related amidase
MASKALIIIDMQNGSFTPTTVRFESKIVIERINSLSELFRAKGDSVIFIQHDGTKEGSFFPGTDEWAILSILSQRSGDLYIDKTINDSFYHSKLQATLQNLGINELYFVGCATDFCFDATVKSALSKDFDITIVKDGHTTADRPFASAKTLIDHYNWLWSELTPAAFPIKVIPTQEIIAELKQ